jgi:hypothetical protein
MSKLEWAIAQNQNQFLQRNPRVFSKFAGVSTTRNPFRCNISDWSFLITDVVDTQQPVPHICSVCCSFFSVIAVLSSLLSKQAIQFISISDVTKQLIKRLSNSEEFPSIFEDLVRSFVDFSNHLYRKGTIFQYPAYSATLN